MEICPLCHQTASLMPPCCSYLLTSDLSFPFHPPHHSLKILIPGSLSLCPISILISASMWMILKILASLFLCRSSNGLILHLISATHVPVIRLTLWPRVPWPLQISIQAHYLPYAGTPSPHPILQPTLILGLQPPFSLPYTHLQLPCHALAFLYSCEKAKTVHTQHPQCLNPLCLHPCSWTLLEKHSTMPTGFTLLHDH